MSALPTSASPHALFEHLTHSARARLEALPVRQRLQAGSLTRSEYRALVERALGFYAPLESALAQPGVLLGGFDYHGRWKTPLLARDLDMLRADRRAYPPVARCVALPSIGSPSEALGAWYVTESLSLLNRAAYKPLCRTLGFNGTRGAAFLAGYGGATGLRWRAFVDDFEHRLAADADFDACVQAMLATCEAYCTWMGALAAPRPANVHRLHENPAVPPTDR